MYRSDMKQIVATKAERPKAAKAQVVGVGKAPQRGCRVGDPAPHDN